MAIVGAASPVPVSDTVCEVTAPSVITVSVPVCGPTAVGANVIANWHGLPGDTVVQVLCSGSVSETI